MKKRDFLKLSGIGGVGLLGAGLTQSCKASESESNLDSIKRQAQRTYKQVFNMSGFAAPKIDTVRIAYIGVGNRGTGAIKRIVHIDRVEVKAVCDVRPEQVEKAKVFFEETTHKPTYYSGSDQEWKKVCERDDIDLIYICTPWNWHAPMALYAMEQGKHVACEIPVATTVEDCW